MPYLWGMEILKLIGDIFKFAIPAIAVYLTMRYLMEQNAQRDQLRDMEQLRRESTAKLLPMRLSAFERLALYLERISLQGMVMRAGVAGKSAAALRTELAEAVALELEHNLVQQIYVPQTVWNAVLRSKEETLTAINMSVQQLPADAPAMALAQLLLEQFAATQTEALQAATNLIREEIKKLY